MITFYYFHLLFGVIGMNSTRSSREETLKTHGSVFPSRHASRYTVRYQALREGKTKMFVKVNGRNIAGSPFNVRGYTAMTGNATLGLSYQVAFGPRCLMEANEPPAEWTSGVCIRVVVGG